MIVWKFCYGEKPKNFAFAANEETAKAFCEDRKLSYLWGNWYDLPILMTHDNEGRWL